MRAIVKTEDDRANLIAAAIRLRLDGKRSYEVSIKVARQVRSVAQNRLYWMWLHLLQDETDNPMEGLHEFFKQEFLAKRGLCKVLTMGLFGSFTSPMSTTDLDTKQFTEYLDRIHLFASEQFGVDLPQPDTLGWQEFVLNYGEK